MEPIKESELILNQDGSIYHINLKPENIADIIIVVGDQWRVKEVSKYFTSIEFQTHKREFITHTGYYNGKRITAMSTGIGPDNLDIVINELDAIVNIDLKTRLIKEEKRSLTIVRLGTSGALQGDIPVDNFVVSEAAIGFDGLMNYYNVPDSIFDHEFSKAFIEYTGWKNTLPYPYVVKSDPDLFKLLSEGNYSGVTATAPGFYGPQGRVLRIPTAIPQLNDKMESFRHNGKRITNFEMETSALYGLCAALGHKACTVCTIIANRVAKQFSKDYHPAVDRMIKMTLDRLTQ